MSTDWSRMNTCKRLVNWGFFFVLLILAYALKRHYSQAGAQELEWILGPIAALVGWAGGMSFEAESATGYIDRGNGTIIAPACAGVNFMIVAILSAGWGVIPRLQTVRRKAAGLLSVAVSAYVLTIAVNSLRILLSIHLYHADIYSGWITPEGVHRLTGIVLYVLCLCGYCLIVQGLLRATRGKVGGVAVKANTRFRPGAAAAWILRSCGRADRQPPGEPSSTGTRFSWTPFFWYAAVVVGVPLARGAYRQSMGRFGEHCLAVIAGCSIVMSLLFLIRTFCLPYLNPRGKAHAPDNFNRGR